MGKDQVAGQPGADAAKPPQLPADLPQDLRDFVQCTSASVTIKDGPQPWVTLPDEIKGFVPGDAKPELKIEPGSAPGTATIKISLGFLSLSVPAAVTDGRLTVDTSALPSLAPASIAKDLTAFVDTLNAWFKANGKGLAPPAFGAGETSLSKVAVVEYIKPTIDLLPDVFSGPIEAGPNYGSMTANELQTELQNVAEELRAEDAGFMAPFATLGSLLASKGPADEAAQLDKELADYLATAPPNPELTKLRDRLHRIQAALAAKEAAKQAALVAAKPPAAKPPAAKPADAKPADAKPAGVGPMVGAGGPGGPKAPVGLGRLGALAVVMVILLAVIGIGAYTMLGPKGPDATPTLGPPVTTATPPVPGETTLPLATTVPTAAVSLPPAVISTTWAIPGDEQVNHCEHIYTVVFSVSDSNGQSAIYAGKVATFRLLDNEAVRTALIGADGTFQAKVDEHFEATGAGCFSHLQPKVLTVDGQPVF